ncbi:MAG TPA: YeeE/YedE thiosulfate transporter family protein [bacterium]|nr:YeeE/YedE thiosulfate transporter family protein [bacterium]
MEHTIFNVIFVERWQWWAGGIALGLTVPLFYLFFNTALGVSTGYGNLVKIALHPKKLRWFNSEKFSDVWNWRFFFMAGIITGGFLSSILSGEFSLKFFMDEFTGFIQMPFTVSFFYMFFGGLLLGLGSRIAGGCTSGHSIHGISQLHFPSIIITIFFILFGAAGANIVRLIFTGRGI